LVSALVTPNHLLMVKLEELHLSEWQIVRESRMVSRTHFLTEFDLHLMDLTFVPKVHNGAQMGFWDIDESLFPIIAPRRLGEVLRELQRPTAINTDGSKTEILVGFGRLLDDTHSYRFRLPGHCGIFTAEMCAIHFACNLIESKPMGAYIILTYIHVSIEGLKLTGISYCTNDMLFRTRRSLRYLITLMWISSHH
jgi:hypothetical protein